MPACDVLSSVEFQPEADLVNLLGGSQDPQGELRKDKIIDAIERPHQARLQNTTVGVVLIFHCWIKEVDVEENGSTTSTQIYSIGKSFNPFRFPLKHYQNLPAAISPIPRIRLRLFFFSHRVLPPATVTWMQLW